MAPDIRHIGKKILENGYKVHAHYSKNKKFKSTSKNFKI